MLQQYESLEGVYEHIDDIKGKVKEKLINDKENAFFSKDLATIYKFVPLNMTFENIKMGICRYEELMHKYEELEFYSLIKKQEKTPKTESLEVVYVKDKIDVSASAAYYIECDNENYHIANIIGASVYDGSKCYYLDIDAIKVNKDLFSSLACTYDYKKNIVLLKKFGIKPNCSFDTLIASYLLNYNVKDDISYLANIRGYKIDFYENIVNKKKPMLEELVINNIVMKSKFLYETKNKFYDELNDEKLLDLFNDIEMPLINVLASMEMEGIIVSKSILSSMEENIKVQIDKLANEIYDLCGLIFNINSPKQLKEVLFDKLNLPHGKKMSTDVEHLNKIKNIHPVIEKILKYRNLNKLYTTYIGSLGDYILSDGKIHTIFKQTITRTGRLSSVEPNLQNIPIRSEEGRQIRKAFLPNKDSVILSADYSQIELRVLAHISECDNLIYAFNHSEDIHSKVASDIYGIPLESVTKNQRRCAKAVIFGIVYGISGYGLGENLDIDYTEAKKFIDKYLEMYPGVKKYMDDIVSEAKQTFSVRTMFNRKRVIDELKNTNYMIRSTGERIAMNTPIQGSSADIIKKAMIEVYNELESRNLKSKIIIQVHDELVLNVYNDELDEVKALVKRIMEGVCNLAVPLKVEIDYGNDWYEAK